MWRVLLPKFRLPNRQTQRRVTFGFFQSAGSDQIGGNPLHTQFSGVDFTVQVGLPLSTLRATRQRSQRNILSNFQDTILALQLPF